jgi:YegS/Rv2252/BmrU family lipid kinase
LKNQFKSERFAKFRLQKAEKALFLALFFTWLQSTQISPLIRTAKVQQFSNSGKLKINFSRSDQLLKTDILFIVNPISGGRNKASFAEMVDSYLDREKFSPRVIFSQYRGHAHEEASKAAASGCPFIVAVGGDGTVNEIASAIEGTETSMGIIPFGSGNGLARSLKIPMNCTKALSRLNSATPSKIDVADLNGKKFFNVAGMGFDAHISHVFATSVKRGLKGYVKTAFAEFSVYKEQAYKIEIDGRVLERDAFMVCIANSSQFGNNAHVSPKASLVDGLLDICIVKAFPLYWLPVMGYHMFSKTSDRSKYVELFQGKQIKIMRSSAGPIHLDGEPVIMDQEIFVQVRPASLNVLV